MVIAFLYTNRNLKTDGLCSEDCMYPVFYGAVQLNAQPSGGLFLFHLLPMSLPPTLSPLSPLSSLTPWDYFFQLKTLVKPGM